MKKIELSELKYYLGAGLMVDVVTMFSEGGTLNETVELTTSEIYNHTVCDRPLTPHVYPLSMLTEEITVDGEKFVPIVELSKLISQASFSEKYIDNWIYNKEQNVATLVYKGMHHPNSEIIRNNFFDIDTDTVNFSIGSFDSENNTEFFDSGCQLQMFQKLFDWNLDVFNWLDQGLAIDKSKV